MVVVRQTYRVVVRVVVVRQMQAVSVLRGRAGIKGTKNQRSDALSHRVSFCGQMNANTWRSGGQGLG